ncbi:Ger(x)C family spore germination C-terminal domain-containing protein, partial [Aneurinibacillus migulanus]
GKMQSGSSFLLQNVVAANGEVKFAGAAVIKGKIKKLGGFFNEIEVEGLTWIIGKGKGGVVKSFDKQTGQLLIYEVESMKSRITPHINGKNISFNVKIESEGRLSENWITSGNAFENKFLKRVEKNTEKEIKRLVKNVVEKMQEEYEADVVGFGNRLKMENPKVWEKVKKNWDQTFSKVPITYNIEVTIKDYGASDSNK